MKAACDREFRCERTNSSDVASPAGEKKRGWRQASDLPCEGRRKCGLTAKANRTDMCIKQQASHSSQVRPPHPQTKSHRSPRQPNQPENQAASQPKSKPQQASQAGQRSTRRQRNQPGRQPRNGDRTGQDAREAKETQGLTRGGSQGASPRWFACSIRQKPAKTGEQLLCRPSQPRGWGPSQASSSTFASWFP